MDSAIWEYGICPLCGNNSVERPIYRFNTGSISLPFPPPEDAEFLMVVRCSKCGLAYLYPRLSEAAMNSVYSSSSYYTGHSPGGYEDYFQQEISLRRTFRGFLISLFRRGLTGGALADIGCGHGYLLDMAKPFFDKRMGTDMSPEVAERGSALCDGVLCGGPQDLSAKGKRFNLVTAISVIEHIYDPVSFLSDCSELLVNGGAIVMVTPDINGFWRHIMGRHWPSFILPDHIAFYDKNTLAFLAFRASMELSAAFPYHHWFPLGLTLSKLGIPLPEKWKGLRTSVMLPKVMLTAVFKKREKR